MRTLFTLSALMVAASVTACTSVTTVVQAGRNGSVGPTAQAGSGESAAVVANCTDSASDAASLQRAIDSSSPGALIEIRGGVCLLDSGIVFLGDRTYAGGNTNGTILKQNRAMSYVLASQAYADNSSWTGDPVIIRDLTVQCNGSGHTNGIVVLNYLANVQEVNVNDCGGSGIVDTNSTANGRAIKNSSVNSRFDNNFIRNSGRYGFSGLRQSECCH